MIYILTSTDILIQPIVRPQESSLGDPAVSARLSLQLKKQLLTESYLEQQNYLNSAAKAVYISLNKLDQRQRFCAKVNLKAITGQDFHFVQGSSSSGLGYALSVFESWWQKVLNKTGTFKYPVFATGEILPSGQVNRISHLPEKISAMCSYVKQHTNEISCFYFCFPSSNDKDISQELRKEITQCGGIVLPTQRLQDMLVELLGNNYDGEPMGRWQPFKGLKSFDYEDNLRFFGRDKEIKRLSDDLHQNQGLLIVAGGSGTGKSSLIKAGLIPQLEKEQENLYWSLTTPNHTTNGGITKFVIEQLNQAWSLESKGVSLSHLFDTAKSSDGDLTQSLQEYITADTPLCLLYIDQYEEVFNQGKQNSQSISQELRLLDELARQITPLNIVIALRNEYLGRLLDNQALRSPIISNVSSQLSPDDWYAIIHEQADFSGIDFEKDEINHTSLDEIIISEAVKTDYALPMVEFLLEQLYLKAIINNPQSHTLKFNHYKQLGGLTGAIANWADQVFEEQESNALIQAEFFDTFVGLNEDQLPYARTVDLERISNNNQQNLLALIQSFIDANLIINVNQYSQQKTHEVKLAHDSLFDNWKKLSDWIKKHQKYMLWRYIVNPQFQQWKKLGLSYVLKDKVLLKEGKQHLKDQIIYEKDFRFFIQLSQKERKRLQNNRIFLFIILPILIFGYFWWDYNRIKSYHYKNFGEHWSIPYGIEKLSGSKKYYKKIRYRFDYQGGLLKKVRHENIEGTLVSDKSRGNLAQWEYSYNENGKVSEIKVKSKANKIQNILQFSYITENKVIISFSKGMREVAFLSSKSTQYDDMSDNNTNISRNLLIYDDSGYIVRKFYQNPYGTPTSDSSNIFGKSYKYNEKGLKIVEKNLRIDGNVLVLNGIYETRLKYDDNGNHKETKHIDKKGHLVLGKQGFAKLIKAYSEEGNVDSLSYYDMDDELIMNNYGYAQKHIFYDFKNSEEEILYLGINNSPVINKDGFAKRVNNFDKNGRVVESTYYGLESDTKKILNNDGCSQEKFKYDKNGNLYESACYGLKGQLTLSKNNTAKEVVIYDNKGNYSEIHYYDTNRKLIINKNGYAKVIYKYNEFGYVIEESFLDSDNQLIINNDGYAKILAEYDERGNLVKESFYGKNELPTINISGYFSIKHEINILGKLTSQNYYDIDGELKLNNDGYASAKYNYDDYGNLDELSYFDEKYNLINSNKIGYAKRTKKHDGLGNIIEESFFGSNGQLVLNNDGYAKWEAKFDKQGNLLEDSYYDESHHLILRATKGYARWIGKVNNRGELIESSYFDADNNLIFVSKMGYAKLTIKENIHGKTQETSYFDANNKLIFNKNVGYARVTYKYNKQGGKIEDSFFNADNNLIINDVKGYAQIKRKFDNKGNLIEASFYDNYGSLMLLNTVGYARVTFKFNENGKRVEDSYWDLHGNLTMNKYGFSRSIDNDNELLFFDTKGNVVPDDKLHFY